MNMASSLSLVSSEAPTSWYDLLDPHQAGLHDRLESLRAIQHGRVLEGLPVYDLSMVNPDLSPPRQILDRLLESVTKTTNHRYAVSRGVRRLREGFAVKYGSRFGVSLHPDTDVCVCLGSKDALFHALRVLTRPGDPVIVATPSYPAHPSAVSSVGARVVRWSISAEEGAAAASLLDIIKSSHARVLLLNLPSNPSGMAVSPSWWRTIGAVCARHHVVIINDFVYGEMCFSGNAAPSGLSARESGACCVEVYSLSKAYNVPGWRVGALVGDAEIVGAVARLKSHADYGLFLPLQYAATVALTASEDLVRPTVGIYERRLRVLSQGLERVGWDVTSPAAGACLWAQFPHRLKEMAGGGSIAVAEFLLKQVGLVATPGVVFGEDCDGYLRFAAVTSEERLREVSGALSRV